MAAANVPISAKTVGFAQIAVLASCLAVTSACAPTSRRQADAERLTTAYATRSDAVIDAALNSKSQSTRLYAMALGALIHRNLRELTKIAHKCLTSPSSSAQDALAYLDCGFAAAAGYQTHYNVKAYYIWTSKSVKYYRAHKNAIDRLTGTSDFGHFGEMQIPPVTDIHKWPDNNISVPQTWHKLRLDNGFIEGYIDGRPVEFMVDTGSGGIIMSEENVKKYGLQKSLIPLNAGGNIKTYFGHTRVNLYYVKSLRLGPITASDVYVTLRDGKGPLRPTIGLDILKALGKFTITANYIAHEKPSVPVECGKMRFTRYNIVGVNSYPFVLVRTGIGTLGLMLDSGLRLRGGLAKFDIYMKSSVAEEILKKHGIDGAGRRLRVKFLQGGTTHSYMSLPLQFYVARMPVKSYSGTLGITDPYLSGALTFPFLKRSAVYFNFRNGRICIGVPVGPNAAGRRVERKPG